MEGGLEADDFPSCRNGYFIYIADERPVVGGITVLGRAASFEAALGLAEVWQLIRHPDRRPHPSKQPQNSSIKHQAISCAG